MKRHRIFQSKKLLGICGLWAVGAFIAVQAGALDCPHCPPSEEVAPEINFGGNGCSTCHITHNGFDALLNPAVGATVEELCRSCHVSGGPGTEVDVHQSTNGGCSDCGYTFTTTCTDCHSPHKHYQPYDDPLDPTGPEGRDFLFRLAVKAPAAGDCTAPPLADCGAGSHFIDGTQTCQADDNCSPNPCLNGGACSLTPNNDYYYCDCPVGYTGYRCESCAPGFTGPPCVAIACNPATGPAGPCGFGTCADSGGSEQETKTRDDDTLWGIATGAGWTNGQTVAGANNNAGGNRMTVAGTFRGTTYTWTIPNALSYQSTTATTFSVWVAAAQVLATNGTAPFLTVTVDGQVAFNAVPLNSTTPAWIQGSNITMTAPGPRSVTVQFQCLTSGGNNNPKHTCGIDGILITNMGTTPPAGSYTTDEFDVAAAPYNQYTSGGGGYTCTCNASYALNGTKCDVCSGGASAWRGTCVPSGQASNAAQCTAQSVTCPGAPNDAGCYADSTNTAKCDCSGQYYNGGGWCDACDAGSGTVDVPFTLTAKTGAGSFADGAGAPLGICEACHKSTAYHQDDGVEAGHFQGQYCMDCHMHRDPNQTLQYGFRPPSDCDACHLSTLATGGQDLDSYVWDDGTTAQIDRFEWENYGHGLDAGSNYLSATDYDDNNVADPRNAGADFVNLPTNGCSYCHDAAVPHNSGTNYFRLANTGGADGMNGVCYICHKAGAPGYDGGAGIVTSSVVVASNHFNGDHAPAGHQGGQFCWDCHDPHGDEDRGADANYATTGDNQPLWFMIQRQPVERHDGVQGLPTLLANYVEFRGNVGTDGNETYIDRNDWTDPTQTSTARGLCNNCHDCTGGTCTVATPGQVYTFNKLASNSHQAGGGNCTNCHTHDGGWRGAGNDCLACHGGQNQGGRRAVNADFANGTAPNYRSHHVGNGGPAMGGTLTNEDCIVCHAEGYWDGTGVKTSDIHHGGNGGDTKINLRDVDLADVDADPSFTFDYDKDAIAAAGSWNSSNATWTAQTSANLDPFCLRCHDANGALNAPIYTGGGPQNPFGDTTITNNYDQQCRGTTKTCVGGTSPGAACNVKADCPDASKSNVGVCMVSCSSVKIVNIRAMVDELCTTAGSCTGPATDKDPGVRPISNAADPAEGIYSRHAVTGQSVSVYSNPGYANSIWNAGRFSGSWNDASEMSCADCHTSDGAPYRNGTGGNGLGNAHGSDSEYLLLDSTRRAVEGAYGSTYNCYQCHDAATYDETHTAANGSDFAPTEGAVGAARLASNGGIFGIACLNCHGGSKWGGIHGTSEVLGVGEKGGAGSRNAYRFMNGSSLRYFDPGNWQTATFGCYTLSSSDSFGGCTAHGTGKTGRTRTLVRNLDY